MISYMQKKRLSNPIIDQAKSDYENYINTEMAKIMEVTKAISEFIMSQKRKQISYSKEELEEMVIKVGYKDNLKAEASYEMLKYIIELNEYINKKSEVVSPGEYFVLHGNAGGLSSTHPGTIPTPNASMPSGEEVWLSER